MPRIIVEAEGREPEVVHWERVCAEDFGAEHFRRCLADRLCWAVQDAERVAAELAARDDAPEEAIEPHRFEREPAFA